MTTTTIDHDPITVPPSELGSPTPPDSPPDAPDEAGDDRARRRRWLDVAVPASLFLGTIATRLPMLSRPNAFVFDEIYYALDGASIAQQGVEKGGVVHPPAGKWIIAIGIKLYGFNPVGFRCMALLCGAIVVVLVYATARRIVAGHALPALAAGLAALDGVVYTTGRIAMLDVFVALFTMLAVWCTVSAIHHADQARLPGADEARSAGLVTRYRWGAAVALGLGIATKWTVAYIVLVCLIGFLAIHARGRGEPRQGRAVARTVLTLVVVPPLIYIACYLPWMVMIDRTAAGYDACHDHQQCSFSILDRIEMFKDDQKRILDFHTGLLSDHNSNADFAYYWIDQSAPAVLFRKVCVPELQQAPPDLADHACDGASPGDVMEIVAVPNPVVWYASLAAGIVLIVKVVRRGNLYALLLLLFFFYQWFPWVIDPFAIKDALLHGQWHDVLQQRRAYSFYEAGMMPVLAVWPALALDHKKVKWLGYVLAATAVAAFLYYWPIWSGYPLAPNQIKAREYWSIR